MSHLTCPCPLCPKAFSQQARLKAHLMTHTGVKHIKCLLCEKAYSVRKSLRRHLLEKHEISPEHPQYKHCFYAMSAAEAGLHIPEGVPTNISGDPTEDDDSTSQSSPKEEEEKPQQPTKKSPKKGATPGRKAASIKQPSTSAAFEDYSSIPSGKGEAQRTTRTRKSPTSKKASKQNEEKTLSTPSTSGEGRHRILKKSRQKTSPRKVTRKERDSEESEEDAASAAVASGEDNDSHSSTPEVIMPQRGRPPRKKRANGNASRPKQTRTRGSPARKVQYENNKPVPAESSLKAKKFSSSATNLGTTRKKRRVEAIVETLQKSTGSPSGSSPKEDEVEHFESDEGNAEVEGAPSTVSGGDNDGDVGGGNNDEGDEDECNGNSGGGFDAVPTLARITPLITRNVPKKGVQKIVDSGQKKYLQNLQHSPVRSLKSSQTEDGDDKCS